MNHAEATNYISKLLGLPVNTTEGKRIGRIADIVLTPQAPYSIVGFLYGESGWEHRLHLLNPFTKVTHSPTKPDMIPWEAVVRVERTKVVIRRN